MAINRGNSRGGEEDKASRRLSHRKRKPGPKRKKSEPPKDIPEASGTNIDTSQDSGEQTSTPERSHEQVSFNKLLGGTSRKRCSEELQEQCDAGKRRRQTNLQTGGRKSTCNQDSNCALASSESSEGNCTNMSSPRNSSLTEKNRQVETGATNNHIAVTGLNVHNQQTPSRSATNTTVISDVRVRMDCKISENDNSPAEMQHSKSDSSIHLGEDNSNLITTGVRLTNSESLADDVIPVRCERMLRTTVKTSNDKITTASMEKSITREHGQGPTIRSVIHIPVLQPRQLKSIITWNAMIGFTDVAQNVEIDDDCVESANCNGGIDAIICPGDETSEEMTSMHFLETSDTVTTVRNISARNVRGTTAPVNQDHDYVQLTNQASNSGQSCTLSSHSTVSDGNWANQMEIYDDDLLGIMQDHLHEQMRSRNDNQEVSARPKDVCYDQNPPSTDAAVDDRRSLNQTSVTIPDGDISMDTGAENFEDLCPEMNEYSSGKSPTTKRTQSHTDDQPQKEKPRQNKESKQRKREPRDFDPNSRQIVRFSDIITQFKKQFTSTLHGPFGCGIANLQQIGEVHDGLRTKFILRCDMCNIKTEVWSELVDDDHLDVNRCSVLGTHAIGKGHAALQEWTSHLNIHCPDWRKYQQFSNEIDQKYIDISEEEIIENGIEVRRLAEQRGSLLNGIPAVDVITDGSFHTRSYGGKSRSEAGMAVIISALTGKVLFKGYRSRYCYICERIKNGTLKPSQHKCWVNWPEDQSILNIESDIIVEGFMKSREQHGLIYSRLIADGDSSVYAKILQADPYEGICTVEKIECRLHLQRCRIKEIRNTAQTFRPGRSDDAKELKTYMLRSIPRICKDVTSASRHWAQETVSQLEKMSQLKRDLCNVIDHVFGNHSDCAPYFCNGQNKPGEVNLVPLLEAYGLYEPLKSIMETWSFNASDLLEERTSNLAECFNSLLAKFNYHKGVNMQFRGRYVASIAMAAIQKSNAAVGSTYHIKTGKIPPLKLLAMEKARTIKNLRNRRYIKTKKFRVLEGGQTESMKKSTEYGKNAEKADLPAQKYKLAEDSHWQMLGQWQKDREDIERITRDSVQQQSLKDKKLLMSTSFGRVARMRTTYTSSAVENILYPRRPTVAIQRHEENVKSKVRKEFSGVEQSGILIDSCHPYLAAKPDGLLPNGDLLIIHSPYNIRNMTIEEAMKNKKFGLQKIIVESGKDDKDNIIWKMNQNHPLYYEVVGSMAVTGKTTCLFVIATNIDSLTIAVEFNAALWDKILPKLEEFYKEDMLPEIVDSRKKRKMSLRKARPQPKQQKGTKLQNVVNTPSTLPELDDNCNDQQDSNAVIEQNTYCDDGHLLANDDNQHNDSFDDGDNDAFVPTELSELDWKILLHKFDGGELDATHIDVFGSIVVEKTLGLFGYQSPTLQDALMRIRPVARDRKHIQILNRDRAHWVCTYYDTEQIFIYDSYWPQDGSRPSADPYYPYLQRLFPHYQCTSESVSFPRVQQQGNGIDCGPFSMAFAISLIYGIDPCQVEYNQNELRNHLGAIFRSRELTHCPLIAEDIYGEIPDLEESVMNEFDALASRQREHQFP